MGRFRTSGGGTSDSAVTKGLHGYVSTGSASATSDDPMARLGAWSPEQRADSQDLLRRAGYLPNSYQPSGSLDQQFVSAWTRYMNDRGEGLDVALTPDSVSMFERARGGSSSGGSSGRRSSGGGGRGGGGAAPPTFAEVQDNIVQFYEGLVGTTPTGEVQDWLYQKVAGGQSWQQMEQDIEGQTNYKERYPGIENHPEWTGPDYDKFMQSFDAMGLENLGRLLSADEKRQLLSIKTTEDEDKWLNNMVGASLPTGMDILGDDLEERS